MRHEAEALGDAEGKGNGEELHVDGERLAQGQHGQGGDRDEHDGGGVLLPYNSFLAHTAPDDEKAEGKDQHEEAVGDGLQGREGAESEVDGCKVEGHVVEAGQESVGEQQHGPQR